MANFIKSVDDRTRLAGTNRMEVLLFSLGKDLNTGRNETYGVNVFKVREVMLVPDITHAPDMPHSVEGMVSLRGNMIPVINLPKFYIDFDDYKNRNAASDLKREIERLKEQNMEGLVIDLRNNGGGSLQTVVDIAGLFIKDGPVVQIKSTGEPKEVLKDRDKSIVWDGPLVILVNELSASASEIMLIICLR